jgi:digalactosyldiacylglycerol synthase
VFSAGAYFIGKAVWGKGFSELLDLAKHYDDTMATCAPGEPKLHWDIFGAGPDLPAIRARAAKYQVDAAFLGACDHLDPSLKAYRCVLPGYSAFSLRVFSVLPWVSFAGDERPCCADAS